MAESLYLIVTRENKVIESAEIAWSYGWYSRIVPQKKEPVRPEEGMKLWEVDYSKRGTFLNFAIKTMNKLTPVDGDGFAQDKSLAEQNLYGYFGMVGIAYQYLKDRSTEWMLALSQREIQIGEVL